MAQQPWADGYSPVINDARVGEHVGLGQYARSKRIPSAANRSKFGVLIREFTTPNAE